ncbi:MAG: 3-hydroxyacyl-CoA dehydrogenase family protein [Candidatus Thermoplasmatota archaeon]|nr:3-hydroxyacyl-CoA dehydrogenase family protein [Candidatus Thermoplasmatota archaeon]MEC7625323.1 3-hydroxyacyl-CoA dehydrogenase family protein [Candidatus Thermoplasmatota archaeon]MEC8577310.1 3-hydroxyacyl-CoA dehydrogenase family protein [Candidatus Thermoplasmatota archaeon]MEC9194037.1 3-hydroxyacyl-CoA dehydrogenase family protein [Candidatus Thermoplasmatota archaeon]MEE3084751.1 3-hydroxyacyl-CoA dehydrogenase family protein [Candidatus Thermoplasmatota archaeon]
MTLRCVAVVGAGTMGAGIAQVCAQAGWKTNLYDAFPEGLERGMERIAAFWEKGIARGKTTPDQRESWAANLTAVDDLARAVGEADLIIEAVPELPELKHSLFAKLDELAPPHAVLGTNTSSLSIADIAGATSRPERVIGMHFFNPVPIMKLLELVRHDRTSDATVAIAEAAGEAMGKTTILVKDVPGFATSRLGVVLGNEAIRMLADGVASAKDIDTAMVLGYKHPMGPLALTDLVGLDVRRDILLNLQRSFNDDSYAPHPLLERLVAEGRLGKKTGKGIYDWSTGQAEETELD